MSKLIPDNMLSIFGSIVTESADVHPKNRQYGFLGTLQGPEHAKQAHVRMIAPHAKAALQTGLAKHQASDAASEKLYGLKTTSSERRKKQKVTNRTVEHFLDSVHGRHIADSLNSGKKHTDNPGSLHSRAHNFMRDYDPKLHEEVFDRYGGELTEEQLGKREDHNVNVARSVYHCQLVTQGLTVSCPEYIKKMQDFLAGYKNGSSIAESHEIVTVNWDGDVWNDDVEYALEEALKSIGDAKSDIHKHVKKIFGSQGYGAALKGTISNVEHHDDGASTVHIRHTKPQTENVVKMLRDVRYKHGQGVRDKAGEVLNSKTSSPGQPSLHISTSPLSGGWYHTKLHVTNEQANMDEATVYKGSDEDDEEVPGSTAMAASQIGDTAGGMSEAVPSPDGGPAKRLTTEGSVVSKTDEPTDGEDADLPSGLAENLFIEEFSSHGQASERKEYLDKKHPRTIHEVIQGRRSGKYFVVRKNQHGSHVAEAVNFPDLEQGAATQTLTNYDGKAEPVSGQAAIGEDAAGKTRRVSKIKSIIKSKE
jgi:hypothetical protein